MPPNDDGGDSRRSKASGSFKGKIFSIDPLHGKVPRKHDTKTRTFTSAKSSLSYLPINEEVDEEEVSLILGRIKTKFHKRRRKQFGTKG